MSDTLFREHLLGTFPQTCLSLRRKLWSLEQFAKYAAGRAKLASEYARGLERLGQKTAATANVFFEESGVTLLWAQVQEAEAGFARAQTALAAALQERVADQLALVKTTTETLLRNIEGEGAAAARAHADARQLADRARDAYQRACSELEAEEWRQSHHAAADGSSWSSSSSSSSSKSRDKEAETAQKREKRMARARGEAEAAEAQYRAAVDAAAGAQSAYYGAQLPRLLDSLEMVYTQRASTIHAALAEYGAAALAAARAAVPLYEGVVAAAARFAPRREVEEYVSRTEQYFAPPPAPAFAAFVRTPPGQVPPLVAERQSTWAGKLHTKLSAALVASTSGGSSSKNKSNSNSSGGSNNSSSGSSSGSSNGNSGTASPEPKGLLLGRDLGAVMAAQAGKYPGLRVPHAYVWLADAVLRLGGAATVGVFRVSGALPAIEAAKRRIDAGECPPLRDVHDASCLLKFFLRSLPDALVPTARYAAAVAEAPTAHDVFAALPEPNRTVAGFVLRYLREHFLPPTVVAATQMGLENLITVFVPCFLRSPTADLAEFIKHGDHERVWLRKCLVALDLSPYPSLDDCLAAIHAAEAPSAAPAVPPPPPEAPHPRHQQQAPPPPPPRRKALPQVPVPAQPEKAPDDQEHVEEAQQEEEEQQHVSPPPRKPLPVPVPQAAAVGTPEGCAEEDAETPADESQ